LRFGAYFGGVPLEDNITEFKNANKNPHVIIATPGRLKDLARNNIINFGKVNVSLNIRLNSLLLTNATRSWVTQA
jgi:superfamily II DNA/RNA helicase